MAAVQARQDSRRSAELGKRAGGTLMQGVKGIVTFPRILKTLKNTEASTGRAGTFGIHGVGPRAQT